MIENLPQKIFFTHFLLLFSIIIFFCLWQKIWCRGPSFFNRGSAPLAFVASSSLSPLEENSRFLQTSFPNSLNLLSFAFLQPFALCSMPYAFLVPRAGVEPAQFSPLDPKSSASASSATSANALKCICVNA